MGNLIAGLALIMLALIVVLAAVLNFTASDVLSAPEEGRLTTATGRSDDSDSTVIVTLGQGDLIAPPPLAEIRKSPEDEMMSKAIGLTPRERSSVDSDGYLIYTVKKGENLSGIADRYLGRSSLWQEIMHHNREENLTSPLSLREGMQIKIPLWLKQTR